MLNGFIADLHVCVHDGKREVVQPITVHVCVTSVVILYT